MEDEKHKSNIEYEAKTVIHSYNLSIIRLDTW